MTITGQSSLAKDDIERMVRDAEAHAQEDRRRKDEAEVRNQADTLVYQTDKLLNEQGAKLPGDELSTVQAALADLRSALEGDNVEQIRIGTERLMNASQTLSQKLYEQAAAQNQSAAGGAGADSAPNDEDVVDAEIVDGDGA